MSGLKASAVSVVVVGVVGEVGVDGEVGVATTGSPVSVAGWAFTHPATSGRARSITISVCRIAVGVDESDEVCRCNGRARPFS